MKKKLANLSITLIALMAALLFAELASRFFLSPPQKIVTTEKLIKSSPVVQTSEKKRLSIASHPDEGGLYRGTPTGRRLNPNRIVTIENHRLSKKRVQVETNSIGYRNREIGEKQGARILFLGDSVTFQDFLSEDETFVRLIEKKAKQNNKNWETINSAVGAISLKTELAILLESGLNLKPDVVVVDFYLNDFQESKGVTILTLPVWMEKSWFMYHISMWVNQLQGNLSHENNTVDLVTWQHEFEQRVQFSDGNFNDSPQAFNTMIKNGFADYGGVWSDKSWEYMYPLFEELKRLSLEHHFKLLIVGFPIYQQVYTEFVDDYPQQQLKRVGKELEIPVFDLLPPLRAEALRLRDTSMYHSQEINHDLFYDQCHNTPMGSALVADQVYGFIANNYP